MNNPSIAINYFNCSIEAMWDILDNIVWSQQCRSYNTIPIQFVPSLSTTGKKKLRENQETIEITTHYICIFPFAETLVGDSLLSAMNNASRLSSVAPIPRYIPIPPYTPTLRFICKVIDVLTPKSHTSNIYQPRRWRGSIKV